MDWIETPILAVANNFTAMVVLLAAAGSVAWFLRWRHVVKSRAWDEWSIVLCGLAAENICWAAHRGYWGLVVLSETKPGLEQVYIWLLMHRDLVTIPTLGAVVSLAVVMSLLSRRVFGRMWLPFSLTAIACVWLIGLAIATL